MIERGGGRNRLRSAARAAVVALAVAVPVQAVTWVEAHRLEDRAARSDAAAVALAAETTELVASVVAARAEVLDARERLAEELAGAAGAEDDRQAATAERDAADAELAALQVELADLQAQLVTARYWRDVNALTQSSLDGCLDGVARALSRLSVGDEGGALEQLAAIREPCAATGVVVG